jgi:hypothetical protein
VFGENLQQIELARGWLRQGLGEYSNYFT